MENFPPKIRWFASPWASWLYAAAALVRGQDVVDRRVAEALAPSVGRLQQVLDAGDAATVFWRSAVPLNAAIDVEAVSCWERFDEGKPDVCNGIVFRPDGSQVDLDGLQIRPTGRQPATENLLPPQANIAAIGSALGELFAVAERVLPDHARELSLREGPLRSAWEARGPGLLHAMSRIAPQFIFPQACDVLLVYPLCGGGGDVYPEHNAVSIEALLANPHPQLPEVVRLAWLLAQLQRNGSDAPADERRLLETVLQAAEEVELVRCDEPTLQLAERVWKESPCRDG